MEIDYYAPPCKESREIQRSYAVELWSDGWGANNCWIRPGGYGRTELIVPGHIFKKGDRVEYPKGVGFWYEKDARAWAQSRSAERDRHGFIYRVVSSKGGNKIFGFYKEGVNIDGEIALAEKEESRRLEEASPLGFDGSALAVPINPNLNDPNDVWLLLCGLLGNVTLSTDEKDAVERAMTLMEKA